MKAVFLAALVITGAASPALAVTGSAEAGLLAMRKTNLIVLGNWTTGHDVEGKTFVGGNASGNSAALGIGNALQGQDASSRRTLTIVGNNNANNLNINNGSNGGSGRVATTPGVAIGGNSGGINFNAAGSAIDIGGNFTGGNVNLVTGQTVNVGGRANAGFGGTAGATVNAGGNIGGNANGASFNQNLGTGWNAGFVTGLQAEAAQLSADVLALSATLGNLGLASNPSSITSLGGRAIFNAVDGGNGFALFNVNAAFFSSFTEVRYNFGSTTLPVIINVTGTNITYNLNAIGGNSSGNRQVIWNFIEATTVTLLRMVNGSVLAPKAALSNNTPIEGSVVAASFVQGGEVHMGTYGADAAFLPEPGSWVQMIAGFGLVGAFARRRRRVIA
jgi:choice-of-anchor A domain-containing protein